MSLNNMTSSPLRWLMVVVALLVTLLVLLVWWLPRPKRTGNASVLAARPGVQRVARPTEVGRKRQWPAPTSLGSEPAEEDSLKMSESQLGLMDVLLRMRLGQLSKLTPEQVEEWLAKEGRSAVNLLAAHRLLNDPAMLEEAARKFPNDTRVQMEVLLKGLFPGDRQRWLEAFKRSAPGNSLPNVLAAQEHLKAGRPEQAVQELLMASRKPGLDTYLFDMQPALESAWTTSGYPQAAGQLMSTFGTQLPVISALQDVAARSADMAAKLRQGGDTSSADAMASAGAAMGQQLNENGRTFIAELVGMQIESKFLQQVPADAPAGGSAQTAGLRLAELKQQQEELVRLAKSFDDTTPLRVSDADIGTYFERLRRDGEFSAMQWLQGRLDQK
ncbi:MAG: hypothetical protein HZC54_19965 [Verrucomicrobia bacterium]|nr:hypothetical protein [Verrucomicrobiota bacterium]